MERQRTICEAHGVSLLAAALQFPLTHAGVASVLPGPRTAAQLEGIAPARELSILLGAYLGGRVLGEAEGRRRLFASVAFAAGVIALALSRT